MSDNWLRYVPADPWFRPESKAAEKARALLSSFLPEAEEVTAEFFPTLQFVDPGGNWSGVCCPSCGADAETWWDGAVSAAADSGFVSLDVHPPCCGVQTSLNDMNYVWPAAFGCFVLDAMNPNVEALSSAQLQQLEHELGSVVREIAQHL
jgi:hypothetical protein